VLRLKVSCSQQPSVDQNNVEDVLFDSFVDQKTDLLSMEKFFAALRITGVRRSDPRINELIVNLRKVYRATNSEAATPEMQFLNRETFKTVIEPNTILILRAFRHQFVIPDFHSFAKDIEEIYYKCKDIKTGKVASYTPQLARVNPDYWGVSVCTIDGQRYSVGDVNIPFTLQSCSKPLTYAVALEALSQKVVHQYIGQEPSGRNFNELVLDHNSK